MNSLQLLWLKVSIPMAGRLEKPKIHLYNVSDSDIYWSFA